MLSVSVSSVGCVSESSRLNAEIEPLGGKYHCDSFDSYTWLRIYDEQHAQEIVEKYASSGLTTDAIICEGLAVRTQIFDVATRTDHPIELHLSNCSVEFDHAALESVWFVDLRGAQYDFSKLGSFRGLTTLAIDSKTLNHRTLDTLKELAGLKQLTLTGFLQNKEILSDLVNADGISAIHLDGTQLEQSDKLVEALRTRFRVCVDQRWLDRKEALRK